MILPISTSVSCTRYANPRHADQPERPARVAIESGRHASQRDRRVGDAQIGYSLGQPRGHRLADDRDGPRPDRRLDEPDRPVELARAGAGLQRRAAVCRRLGAEPSGQKGKLTLHSFLFGTAWRCVPNLLPRKGEHFLCPSPAGRSTILNALRVALRIISGKYIF